MIYLAYDGSLNGDWVARYAMRMALHAHQCSLTLVHIREPALSEDLLAEKLERIEGECAALGVNLHCELRPPAGDVHAALLRAIPPGAESIVVAGTRVRARNRSYLAGTIAERLLQCGRFPVLALRVVQPGLLGHPRRFLLPLSGHPRGVASVWPFFRLFLPEMENLVILRGMIVSPQRLRHLETARIRGLREAGVRYLGNVAEEIRCRRGAADFMMDSRIVISDDWPHEILVHASQLRSRMILLGASERALWHRLLHGRPFERVLRDTSCDVGVYRGL